MSGKRSQIKGLPGFRQPAYRVGVPSGAIAQVPTETKYQVQATTRIGRNTLKSNIVTLSSRNAHLVAQVMQEGSYYDFQLVEQSGVKLE